MHYHRLNIIVNTHDYTPDHPITRLVSTIDTTYRYHRANTLSNSPLSTTPFLPPSPTLSLFLQ